jgi:alkaline phosphatase D
MSVGRREFIMGTLGTAAAAQLLAACGDDGEKASVDLDLFAHGVASGDPLADAVILWTRVSDPAATTVQVEWRISRDPQLAAIVKSGTATTTAELDYTVKVDVTGLEAGTTYYYEFRVGSRRSLTGRTRTMPVEATRARIAVTSCANYQNGYFNVYGAIAKRLDLDLWVHLGDYIYEYKAGEYADPNLAPARSHLPANEAVSLQDYRTRYAQYRSDPDLQAIHRQHPLVVVWDDHEFANNAYVEGAQNHNSEQGEGDWNDRKRAASRAYLEWLPLRVTSADPVPKIFRTFKFADLFDLIMLDTRMLARAKQAGDDELSVGDPAVWRDSTRQLLGTEQETWFLNELSSSKERGARWRLVGNQVIISQARDPRSPTVMGDPTVRSILYSDFWDGYQPARDRVFNFMFDSMTQGGIQNVVFLTGDIHTSWAFEVSKDPFDPAVYNPLEGRNAFAIELVGPSVTSQALEGTELEAAAPLLLPAPNNPHLKYIEVTRKGYVLVDLSHDRMQAEWWYVKQYKVPNAPEEELAKAFTCQQSTATLVATTTASPSKDAPPAAV